MRSVPLLFIPLFFACGSQNPENPQQGTTPHPSGAVSAPQSVSVPVTGQKLFATVPKEPEHKGHICFYTGNKKSGIKTLGALPTTDALGALHNKTLGELIGKNISILPFYLIATHVFQANGNSLFMMISAYNIYQNFFLNSASEENAPGAVAKLLALGQSIPIVDVLVEVAFRALNLLILSNGGISLSIPDNLYRNWVQRIEDSVNPDVACSSISLP